MVTDEQALTRPIGWWLKEADARLDAAFDRALHGAGADRRGWQVLSSLGRRPMSSAELVAALAPFDPADAVQAVVDDLQAREWVEEADGLLRLTAEGARQQTALAPLVAEVRRRVSSALPEEDYGTLVRLLARLTQAL